MKKSAGIVPYHFNAGELKVLLSHPGGPYCQHKQYHCWSIIKGEFDHEEPLEAAKREFREETSFHLLFNDDEYIKLTPIVQRNKKIVYPFAIEDEIDTKMVSSNMVTLEYPEKSGKKITFPEIDRAEYFTIEEAKKRINPAQIPLLEELSNILNNKH